MTITFCLFGSFLGAILAAAVFSHAGDEGRLNRWLALLLLLQSVGLGTIAGQHGDLVDDERWLVLLEYTTSFLVGPALFFYALAVIDLHPRVPPWIHLVPATGWGAYVLTVLANGMAGGGLALRLPPIMALVAYMGAYTVSVAIVAFRRRPETRRESHLLALRVVAGLMIGIQVSQIVRFLFRDVEALVNVVPLTGAAGVCCLSLVAIRSSSLFDRHEKYTSSKLSDDEERGAAERLRLLMEREHPYLDQGLKSSDLARRLKVSRSHLSQVVNSQFGVNLPELVNSYRVEAARRLLADPGHGHLTIEAIGHRAGFRSRSAFYQAYRRAVGESPSQTRAHSS